MGADPIRGIGPVSVRYAAQIREMLHAQAIRRMAAAQEAARVEQQAERTERLEPARLEPARQEPQPAPGAKAEAATTQADYPPSAPEPRPAAEPAVGKIVDELA